MRRQLHEYRPTTSGAAPAGAIDGLYTAGDPQDLADQLAQLARHTHADALNIRVQVAGLAPAAAREQIACMGRDVLPLLRKVWAPT